jgi:hypothetical protein
MPFTYRTSSCAEGASLVLKVDRRELMRKFRTPSLIPPGRRELERELRADDGYPAATYQPQAIRLLEPITAPALQRI